MGFSPPNWLLRNETALGTLQIFDLWRTVGFQYVVVLAGLQGIPRTPYEAAEVDGVGAWGQFWHVTVPMLSPTLLFLSVFTAAGSFQIFDPMYIMTHGGPGDSTLSLVQILYSSSFKEFRLGYGCAIAVLVAATLGVLAAIQFRIGKRSVTYERI